MTSEGPTLLFLHAHPDDECILTGNVMVKAASQGFRTIVVYGTRGDAGETNLDLQGESLGERRVREATAACGDLGVARIEWLPYDDSGMDGTETTNNPQAFSNASPEAVAAELVDLLADESIAAIIAYDANGTYGHPDHRQVHHVGHAAAGPLGCRWVLEATYNREYLAQLPDADGSLDLNFAAAEADLTHFVEGDEWFDAKMRALWNHTSQVPDDVDQDNPDVSGFRARFGTEWFIATAYGEPDFSDLDSLFEPKANWISPLTQ